MIEVLREYIASADPEKIRAWLDRDGFVPRKDENWPDEIVIRCAHSLSSDSMFEKLDQISSMQRECEADLDRMVTCKQLLGEW